ncbi:complexed with Cdc5 protein Cwf18 [Arthroderma uncinatum]|uniref:complexed with Cdc5 protein Cwf18 n=1 Tax=Arthroderma uncinatum TaxID=74035 RepID=UPI00144AF14B|nr:complexed with Cdc5 protein Cwf18 [Arthroderma uncinatum]KAF3480287.1 complexed with Cdc5 protein Cwf18 [Arthroderma uncinatum]
MSSSHTTLDAAAADRKARLAKLASLKRQRPEPETDTADQSNSTGSTAPQYLSGRNYDWESRGAKLGFESDPTRDAITLEDKAAEIAAVTAHAAHENEDADKPIDLFNLQPKKPNWDLKRDLEQKMKVLDVKTENAMAQLVRQRIQNSQSAMENQRTSGGDEEPAGIDGEMLVQGIHSLEREEIEQAETFAERNGSRNQDDFVDGLSYRVGTLHGACSAQGDANAGVVVVGLYSHDFEPVHLSREGWRHQTQPLAFSPPVLLENEPLIAKASCVCLVADGWGVTPSD